MAGPTEEEIAQLFAIHNSPERARENLLRAYGFDSTSTWKDSRGYTLSTRIWRARREVRSQIDRVLREAIANGTDALEVADILEQYLDPALAPVRNSLGRLIRNQKPVIVTRAPGRGGAGSASARRLARTEITRAMGQATIMAGQANPFCEGIRWNLSTSHKDQDICDQHANADDYDLGRGVYPVESVPPYPSHPHDLCTLSQETTDDIDGVLSDLKRIYNL